MVVLTASSASVPVAQAKPDFSGRWVLEAPVQPPPEIPRALTIQQPGMRASTGGEPTKPSNTITVQREFPSNTSVDTYQIGIQGGLVGGIQPDGTRERLRTRHSVRWEGDTLAFESGRYTGTPSETGEWTERREEWSLDATGRLRLLIMTRSSSEKPSEITLIYRRPVK
jgi:hypothetical protein